MTQSKPPVPFQETSLPDDRLHELWGRLILPANVKPRFLRLLDVGMRMGRQVPSGSLPLLGVMLSGDPGVGKTSLGMAGASAWAHDRGEAATQLLIDGHALPSAVRGGTQRNILSLFDAIRERAASGLPIIALINEVETVVPNRGHLSPETNPADTAQACCAFFEGLDRARAWPNVFWIFTSNHVAAIDPAMMDRVPFQFLLRLPDWPARQAILKSLIHKLGSLAAVSPMSPQWNELKKPTHDYSPRALQNLVYSALTFVDHDEPLQLRHVIMAAREMARQVTHHAETGGRYLHRFEESAFANSSDAKLNGNNQHPIERSNA